MHKKPRRGPRVTWICGILLIAGLLVSYSMAGCGATPNDVLDPTTPATRPSTPDMLPPLAEGSAARAVPETAVAGLLVADPRGLFDALQRSELTRRFPEVDTTIVELLEHWIGADITSAERLAEVGVDPDGPGGIAVLDPEATTTVIFATVRDPETLLAAITAGAEAKGGRIAQKSEGDGRIVFVDRVDGSRRAWFVLRGEYAMMLLCTTSDEVGWAHARRLAKLAPDDTLEQDPDLRAAIEGLETATEGRARIGLVFFDLAAVVRPELVALDARTRETQQVIREARAECMRNRPLEDPNCQRLEVVSWEIESLERQKASRELLKQVLLPARSIAVALEAGDYGLRMPGFVAMHQDAMMTQVVVPSRGAAHVAAAPAESPAFLLHGSVDIPKAQELVELFLRAEGESLESLQKELEAQLGFDVVSELLALLTGDVGVAVELDKEALAAGRNEEFFSVHLVLGIRDVAATRALLQRIFSHPLLALLVRPGKEDGRWVAYVPSWKQIHIAVTSQYLIAANDEGTADRVIAAAPPSWSRSEIHAQLLGKDGTVGAWQYDSSWLLFLGAYDGAYYPEFQDYQAGVAWSQASLAKRDELAALDEAHRAVKDKHQEEEAAYLEHLVDALGVWLLTAELAEGGVVLDGGLMLNGGDLASSIATIVKTSRAMKQGDASYSSASDTYYQQRQTLVRELEDLRYQDATSPTP